MICEKCNGKIVMHSFSNGECESCKSEVITSHMPCNVLCDKCSDEQHKCKSCGKNMAIPTTKELIDKLNVKYKNTWEDLSK